MSACRPIGDALDEANRSVKRVRSFTVKLLAPHRDGAPPAVSPSPESRNRRTLAAWQVTVLTAGIGLVSLIAATLSLWRPWLGW